MYDKCVESFFGKIFGLKCRCPGAGPGFSDMPRLNDEPTDYPRGKRNGIFKVLPQFFYEL